MTGGEYLQPLAAGVGIVYMLNHATAPLRKRGSEVTVGEDVRAALRLRLEGAQPPAVAAELEVSRETLFRALAGYPVKRGSARSLARVLLGAAAADNGTGDRVCGVGVPENSEPPR